MINPLNNKYAVVAMGGVFPDAKDLNEYWQNIINKHCSIRELPDYWFDKDAHYDPSVLGQTVKNDKSYTKISSIIEEVDFDPREFRIPPTIAKHMDNNQKTALIAAKQAFSSGCLEKVDKERVSVFMGNTFVGQHHHDFFRRMTFDRFASEIEKVRSFQDAIDPLKRAGIIEEVKKRSLSDTFMVTEDSAPGTLPNIIASRICSVFDLHGHAYVIDAACASSLATIICGIQQLRLNEADAVVCGGADMLTKEAGLILFSGINALSPDGSFPFDERANGFIVGSGTGLVVIKRLSDAIAAEDQILSVITGYGQLSDGKGKAIAAPNAEWQAKAIIRAYDMAGYSPETVELIEAHGTSTQVGDASEVEALKKVYEHFGVEGKQFCGLSSVKSNIGHLKSAAGIAGVLKTVKALHHKVLPPIADFKRENAKLGLSESPFYVVDEAKPWPAKEHPRRAGVNAFGFGGADYHIAFEEYRKSDYENLPKELFEEQGERPSATEDSRFHELLFCSAGDKNALAEKLESLSQKIAQSRNLSEVVYEHNFLEEASAQCRLAFTFDSVEDLHSKVERIKETISAGKDLQSLQLKGIFYSENTPLTTDQMSCMFPGQGSQYAEMCLSLAKQYAPAEKIFSRADALWKKQTGSTVRELISSEQSTAKDTEARLKDTRNTHPALLTTELATFELLKEMEITPKSLIGHSAGEIIALTAAGKISTNEAFSLMEKRADALSSSKVAGAMAALKCSASRAEEIIEELSSELSIANYNSPTQTIISGTTDAIERLLSSCKEQKIQAVQLNVSQAFHSPLMSGAQEQFAKAINKTNFKAGTIEVLANESSDFYGSTSEAVKEQLLTQICGSIHFSRSIEKLYEQGIRLFVEVGPNTVLTNLVKEILADKDDVILLSSDSKKGDSLEACNRMICGLFSAGIPLQLVAPTKRQLNLIRTSQIEDQVEIVAQVQPQTGEESIVYSGVSAGLPGSFKKSFRDDNFEQLFEGKNLIERLTDAEMESLVDLQVSKLVKSDKGPNFLLLDSIEQVIQLAGKVGQIDLLKDYAIDEKEIRNMSSAIGLAVAAGYEALRDAQIPLIREYSKTASGSVLPDRWALPQSMQKDTGVIFANGFPMLDPIIAEVSRHISHKLGSKLKSEIFSFYEEIIDRVTDKESRKLLTDWYALNHSRLSDNPGNEELYTFNHHLMNQLASQANNRLAQYINAQGPNFQLNAACSSTATAITLSEEMIRSGRVKRMIVIGADNAGTKESLPYVGAGFLSTGACSNEGDLFEAALPFDKRRNGMIMGAGAVGFVIESASSCRERGVIPVCELVGSHVFNTAGHHSALDVPRYAEELDIFISRLESNKALNRTALAKSLLYMSHETYTPARGGCSESEAVSLRHVFGEEFRSIEVSNTKGMTGHTMGASIEDAAAAKSLQFGMIPPVVNHKVIDPSLEGLKLSDGGAHACTYALRMAAGFGSQGNYLLLKKVATGDSRFHNNGRYEEWLREISNNSAPELIMDGRRLLIADSVPGAVITQRPLVGGYSKTQTDVSPVKKESTVQTVRAVEKVTTTQPKPATVVDVSQDVLAVIAEITGYGADMLELDMELEADLGVDTVKQATILAMLGEKFGMDQEQGFRISEFPTIGHIVSLFGEAAQATTTTVVESASPPVEVAPIVAQKDITDDVLAVIAEITGYGADMLELDMELEADLGVDTVKQATILAMLGEKFGMDQEQGFRISEFPTIGHMVSLFGEAAQATTTATVESVIPTVETSPVVAQKDVTDDVLAVIAEITGYGADMLELDMELEADLGVDTVKQATILAMLGEKFGMDQEEGFRISEFPTIGHIVSLFGKEVKTAAPQSVPTVATEVSPVPTSAVQYSGAQFQGVVLKATHQREVENRAPQSAVAVVAKHTHYVEEMLLPHYSLGADLELNSEEIQAIANNLGSDLVNAESSIKDLESLCSGVSLPEVATKDIDMARQVLALQESPLADQTIDLTNKKILLIGESEQLLNNLSESFPGDVTTFVLPEGGSVDEVRQNFTREVASEQFDILIDLTCCGVAFNIKESTPQVAERIFTRAADLRFALMQELEAKELIPARILAITATDGSFGLTEGVSNPLFGLLAGFYKGIRKEWEKTCRLSILDLAPSHLEESPETAQEQICYELTTESRGVEVAYPKGIRSQLIMEDRGFHAESVEKSISLTADDTLLAAGGGAGITAKVLIALAEESPCSVVITGRTTLVDGVENYAALTEEELQLEKSRIQSELKSSGKRVTPVLIEKEFSKITKSIEIFETIRKLRSLGCSVLYEVAEIRDTSAMAAVITKAKESFGFITGILHGAGVEISRPMAQKSGDEFHLVHSIKTMGAYNLSHLLKDEPLKMVVAFSSISGRFGNAAQVDYSAGNEFLNYWTRMYNGSKETAAVSLIWSGWAETGMAWRNSFVKEHAEYMGLHLIDPKDGAAAAVREILCNSGSAEVCLNKGLGSMLEEEMSAYNLAPLPMVDRLTHRDGNITQTHRIFSVKRDALLNNHRISGTPLMPGVGFMEMMAESYTLLKESTLPLVYRDVKFSEAFKLYRDESRQVYLNISPTEKAGEWAMDVMAPFKSRLAKEAVDIKYSEAKVIAETPNLEGLNPLEWDFSEAEDYHYNFLDSFAKNFSNNVELGAILDDCKREHTGDKKVFRFNDRAYMRTVRFPIAQFDTKDYPVEQYMINPAFLDTLHQAGAIYSIFSKKEVYLPYGAEEFGVLKPMKEDEVYRVFVQRMSEEGETILYNIVLLNEADEVTAYIRNSLFHRINQ